MQGSFDTYSSEPDISLQVKDQNRLLFNEVPFWTEPVSLAEGYSRATCLDLGIPVAWIWASYFTGPSRRCSLSSTWAG
jgi:hypothetical protein